eukprot:6477007-Amphidinium_carterae.1
MVEGGGRPQRVQYGPIAQAAFNKLLVDLQKSPQGLCIEHAFAEHLINSDSKAARAIFQAQSPEQRLLAFAAALGRAGCTIYEKSMRKAAVQASSKTTAGEDGKPDQVDMFLVAPGADSQKQAETAPCGEQPPPKKRGRPQGSKKTFGDCVEPGSSAHPPPPSAAEKATMANGMAAPDEQCLRPLQQKLDLLEKWAHGVDETLKKLAGSAALARTEDSSGPHGTARLAPLDVQQSLQEAADRTVTQGLQIQQLIDDVAALRLTCPKMAGSATAVDSEASAHHAEKSEEGLIKQDLRKLWALYHRLSMGMREKGILFPEKSLEPASCLEVDPPPPPPPPAQTPQPRA